MKFTFSIREHIKKAWVIYKENLAKMILFVVVFGILGFIEPRGILLPILFIVNIILIYLFTKAILDVLDGLPFVLLGGKAFPTFKMLWNFFKTIVLSAFFVVIGLCLLIIPGIYIGSRLVFACYISIEKNQGARKSIRESWEMTKGYQWDILGKYIIIGLLGFAFYVPFMILLTVPYYNGAAFSSEIGLGRYMGIIALSALGMFLLNLIVYPMSSLVSTMLYKKFKIFSQGDVVPVEPASETPTEATTTSHAEETTVEKVIE